MKNLQNTIEKQNSKVTDIINLCERSSRIGHEVRDYEIENHTLKQNIKQAEIRLKSIERSLSNANNQLERQQSEFDKQLQAKENVLNLAREKMKKVEPLLKKYKNDSLRLEKENRSFIKEKTEMQLQLNKAQKISQECENQLK
eukprot:UN02076